MTTLLILLVIWTTDEAGTTDGVVTAAVTDVNPIKTVTPEISNTDNLHRHKLNQRNILMQQTVK
jgi:hypothetical protein